MKYSWEILNDYKARKLVTIQRHLRLPLFICNYSREVQYEKLWDDVTIATRGLVLDESGEVIALPFKKFFNYEEIIDNLPNEKYEIFEKLDGSLGIGFWYDNEFHIATRGSFQSEQAAEARRMAEKYPYQNLPKEYTYLMEIIYKSNQIVCSYPEDKLVILCVIHTKTGNELSYEETKDLMGNWPIAKRLDSNATLDSIKSLIGNDEEGYVVKYESGLRMKIKGEEYVRLHSILTRMTSRVIWEYLRNGRDFSDFLDRVPDEFDTWIKRRRIDLQKEFFDLQMVVLKEYERVQNLLRGNNIYGREFEKSFALEIQSFKYRSLLFSFKNIVAYPDFAKLIWDQIYPEVDNPFMIQE